MPNVNKVKLLLERTSGAPSVIFIIIVTYYQGHRVTKGRLGPYEPSTILICLLQRNQGEKITYEFNVK